MLALAVQVSFNSAPPATAAGIEWLHVEGNRIVNQSGQTVILRGVNIENREWVWNSSRSIDFERRAIPKATGAAPNGWGANIILLAVASGPINRNDSTYLRHLDELVALAKSNGAYTLLVYRYSEPNSGQPNMPDQAAQNAMAALAARYSSEPAVIYGLQVEPHDVSWSQLKPRFTSMIDAIRARNSRALIAVPGTQWSRYVHWALNDPISRNNLIYKIHYYDPIGAAEGSYKFSQMAARYPVILGEFGTGSMMGQRDVDGLLNLSESLGVSWVAWIFHDRGCPCLLSNASNFSTTSYGSGIRSRLQKAASTTPPPAPTPTPAPGKTPAPTPTQPPSANTTVYGDALQWDNWSWNTTLNPNASSPVYSGNRAMAVTFSAAWGGVSLHKSSFDTSPYSHLQFAIHTSGRPMPALDVSLYNTSGDIIRVVNPGPYATSAANGWRWVSIPLADLGGTNTTITRVQVQEGAGSSQPTFFLDEIRFVDQASTAASFPPLPIVEGDNWRYLKGTAVPPASWTATAFDDSHWPIGPSGFGYGDGDDATVLSDMRNSYVSIYLRRAFSVADPSAISRLVLNIDYDDSFVAYLNGMEVARSNVPGSPPQYHTWASGDHEASQGNTSPQPVERFDLTGSRAMLASGKNILAIQGHNKSLNSSDFTLIPTLND